MSFIDLNLESSYSSVKHDLINDFYVPVLTEAIVYDRITGFFNSASLASVSKGLKHFIKNNGKMRLLCGAELSFDDLDYILNASDIADSLSEKFLDDLSNVVDEIQLNHLKVLAWMVANNVLEIKIGIVKNGSEFKGGILHEKTGILSDMLGHKIVFSGSNNETGAGWTSKGYGNLEKFKVFNSWEDSKFIKDDIEEFEEYWNNKNPYLEVMDVPSAAKEGLIKLAPKTVKEVLELPLSYAESLESKDDRKLRSYQEEARDNWLANNKRGIFEMATGTGKTFTAINCISKAIEDEPNLVTVIACPLAHLVEQWYTDVEKSLDVKCFKLYGSGNHNWRKDLTNLVFDLKYGFIKSAIIFTTHSSFHRDFFIDEINKIENKTLLVVDEMHHVVSDSFREGLLDNENHYNYRLGLSATPRIHNNEEGTEFLFNYFGGIVYTYSLKEALINFNENDETYLTPYDYFPENIELTYDELDEYIELSIKISQLIAMSNKDELSPQVQYYIFERKKLINNAKAKYDKLVEILNRYEYIDHLIIFCSPQQKPHVLDILDGLGILSHQFTQDEGTNKRPEFGGLSEREYLVKKFGEGYYKSLVAIRCLDEGVDIPSAEKVIIMSSSSNPKEYIQRRGRVLRRSEGKEKAEIYDMAVIQKDENGNLIKSIVDEEYKRLMDFINLSSNPDYGMNLLEKLGMIL